MPFIFDDLILLGLAAAPIAGLLGLKKTTDNLDGGGSAKSSYSHAPVYAPPRSAPPPPIPTYETPAYDYSYEPYRDPYGGHQDQGYPSQNEVTLYSQDGGRSFFANVGYEDRVMSMHVDTGATVCVVGGDDWRWLRRVVQSQGATGATMADGRRVSATSFIFPYLTVVGADGQSFVTVADVEGMHIPGQGGGLLGMSFLKRTQYAANGNQMIIRG